MRVLPRGYTYMERFEGFADSSVADSVVWRSRLLDEPRTQGFELVHVFDSLRDVPYLCLVSERDRRIEVRTDGLHRP